MKIENFIALRYIKENRKNKDISSASIAVIIVIAFSIIFFISALSIMNGYIYNLMKIKFEVDSFHLDYLAFINLEDSKYLLERIKNNKLINDEILVAGLYREAKVLLTANGKTRGIARFRSFPEDIFDKDKEFNKCIKLLDGKKKLDNNEIMISRKTADDLGVKIGDHLYLTAMIVQNSPEITLQRLKISGIFTTGYVELDEQLSIIGNTTGNKIFKQEIGYNIFIKLKNYKNADIIRKLYKLPEKIEERIINEYIYKKIKDKKLINIIQEAYSKDNNDDLYSLNKNLSTKKLLKIYDILNHIRYISSFDGMYTWEEKNYNELIALKFEKNVIAFIVILVILVASLNILTTIFITVHEKRETIGILKAVGYSPRNIFMIFLLNGFYLGFIGTLIGIISGMMIMNWLNEILLFFSKFINSIIVFFYHIESIFINVDLPAKFEIFPKDFYLDRIYTNISAFEIVLIIGITLFFSILSSIIPALKAGRAKPFEVMKNG